MNEIALSRVNETLPALVRLAAQRLAGAANAAEVLDARDLARHAYDVSKSTARIAKAKQAHDEVVVAAYRAQADAAFIECAAKRKLADEYDAAVERGEVGGHGGDHTSKIPDGNLAARTDEQLAAIDDVLLELSIGQITRDESNARIAEIDPHWRERAATTAQIGLTPKAIHEGRQWRAAEEKDPGITQRAIDELLAAGEEPTRAAVRRAVLVKPEPVVSRDALDLWGHLRAFDRLGFFQADLAHLLHRMTPEMRGGIREICPRIIEFLKRLESMQ